MRRRRDQPPARGDELRFFLGVAGLALTGSAVRDASIGPVETAVFRGVNRLPGTLHGPAWLVMQAGNFAAVPVTAAFAARAGRRPLARRLLVSGVLAWLLAKVVKVTYRRPRPSGLVDDVTFRGREPAGLGYVSGHAAVSTALALAVYPELGRGGRLAVAAAVPTIATCRIYVGAHLPLDVLGGVALGVAVEAAVDGLVTPPAHRSARRPGAVRHFRFVPLRRLLGTSG